MEAEMASTTETKRQQIMAAWAKYRAESQAIPRSLPFSGFTRGGRSYEGFVEIDERLWRRYLADERSILAQPETKAA
jgi:hypothetical protein